MQKMGKYPKMWKFTEESGNLPKRVVKLGQIVGKLGQTVGIPGQTVGIPGQTVRTSARQ